MKPFIIFVLLCGPVFATDSGIHVVSTTKKDPNSGSVSTEDVFKRDGKTDLVRVTNTKDGIVRIRTHRFYHDGSLLGCFMAMPKSSGFVTEAGNVYSMSFEFDASGGVKSAVVGAKDGEILDIFTCNKGVFSPVDNSALQKANALGADMKRLFDPKHVRETSPEHFGEEAVELVKKHKEK